MVHLQHINVEFSQLKLLFMSEVSFWQKLPPNIAEWSVCFEIPCSCRKICTKLFVFNQHANKGAKIELWFSRKRDVNYTDALSSISYQTSVLILPDKPSPPVEFFPALIELSICENCGLLGYSATTSGKFLQTFCCLPAWSRQRTYRGYFCLKGGEARTSVRTRR